MQTIKQELVKLAGSIDSLIEVLEKDIANDKANQSNTKKIASENRGNKSEFGTLSDIPSNSSNPLLKFILG